MPKGRPLRAVRRASGSAAYGPGDGVVTMAGRSSGYGNYVEIEHNQQYATAYGHLSGFGPGIRDGARVRQGDVIGYVGMTGMATGPPARFMSATECTAGPAAPPERLR